MANAMSILKTLDILMFKSLQLHLLFILFTTQACVAQVLKNCFEAHIKYGNVKSLDSLTNELVYGLPAKDFYLIGESHTFLANNDFQYSLIKILHPLGVYNIVSEQPHAVCFLFNEYLETGEDSLLTLLKPSATYALLKKVRQFNNTQPPEKRMKYYGIDYLDADFDYENYLLALKIICTKIKLSKKLLDSFIKEMAQKETLNAENIKLLQATLHTQLAEESNFYKVHYGKYYYDLLLMSVSMIGRATDRDSEVLENFRFLHKSLVETGNSNPKYLSFYGSGHLFNFGDMLLFGNSSPVKGSVFRIAIQYINCLGGWYWSKESYRDIGLSSIKKKNLSDFISNTVSE